MSDGGGWAQGSRGKAQPQGAILIASCIPTGPTGAPAYIQQNFVKIFVGHTFAFEIPWSHWAAFVPVTMTTPTWKVFVRQETFYVLSQQ